MKFFKPLLALGLLAVTLSSSSAWADRYYHGGYHGGPRVGVGVVIGGPGYYPYRDPFFYPPYPYPYPYPPVVVAPAEPPVYIEQRQFEQAPPQAQPSNDWFYCRKPEGYYPYVKQCPGGWQRVAPQPPPQP
jgi:hypothetical protein